MLLHLGLLQFALISCRRCHLLFLLLQLLLLVVLPLNPINRHIQLELACKLLLCSVSLSRPLINLTAQQPHRLHGLLLLLPLLGPPPCILGAHAPIAVGIAVIIPLIVIVFCLIVFSLAFVRVL